MLIRLLGPVGPYEGDQPLPVGGPNEQRVLALLALQPNTVVSEDRLVEALWGDRPPRTVTHTLHGHVSRLRKVLAADPRFEIESRRPGYLLLAPPDGIDVELVRRLAGEALSARPQDPATAARLYGEAVAAWRGAALDDLRHEPGFGAAAERLDQLRLGLDEERVEAEAACGRSAGSLAEITARGPAAEAPRSVAPPTALPPAPEASTVERLAIPVPPALHGADRSAFVGRSAELDRLRALGRGDGHRAILLAGEPGIGKTRLAAAAAAEAHAAGAIVLYGRCDEEALVPFQPFVEALGAYVAEAPAAIVHDQLSGVGADLAWLLPQLRDQLVPTRNPTGTDPEVERYRLFEAVSTFVTAMSQPRPVLLVLDDLHWADKPTLLLLRHLLRTVPNHVVHVVGTYRDTELSPNQPLAEALADMRREQLVERLAVSGLTEPDVGDLAAAAAGHAVSDELVVALHRQTEGNPFFLGEVLHHLADTGALTALGDLASGSVDDLAIPEGIREVVGRRVRRLGPEANAVLTLASVVGREFDLDVIEAASALPCERVVEALEEALRARLVEQVPGAEARYAFGHVLVRETLYRELITARRIRLHRDVAEALEALHGDAPERLGELALHFSEAAQGDVDKAVDYSRRAGDRALGLLAYEEAAGHYERGLQALELEPRSADPRRGELLLAIGEASFRAGDAEAARSHYLQVADQARRLDDPELLAHAALGLGRKWGSLPMGLDVSEGAVDGALAGLIEEALAALPPADSALRSRLLACLANALHYASDGDRRSALVAEANAMAERLADARAIADTLCAQRLGLTGSADLATRLDLDDRIERIARDTGDTSLAVDALMWRANDLVELGRVQEADSVMQVQGRLAAELGELRLTWWNMVYRAMRAGMAGRFAEAEELATTALHFGQGLDPSTALGTFGGQMLWMWRELGRSVELRMAMDAILDFAGAMPAARAGLAFVSVELGEHDVARATVEGLTADGLRDFPRDVGWLAGLVILSMAVCGLGDAERAQLLYDLLAPRRGHNVLAGSHTCFGPVDHHLGALQATMGHLDPAIEHYEAALRMTVEMAARPFEAHTRAALGAALVLRDGPGEVERGRRELDRGREIAAELGMRPDAHMEAFAAQHGW